jgi:maleate cis-trans isomerase
MYGWRGRLGLILGTPNTVCEPEFARMAPEGVSVHGARMDVGPGAGRPVPVYNAPEVMRETEAEAARLSHTLKAILPDIIIFTHTVASMGDGPDFDRRLTEVMEAQSGCRALTTATAIVEALHALGAQRVAIADPFPMPELGRIVRDFLEHPGVGFTVVNAVSAQGKDPNFITNLPPSVAYQFGRRADCADADVVLLAANVWRTIESIELLEQDLKKPVISANQATLWAALKRIGVAGGAGYGSLFNH